MGEPPLDCNTADTGCPIHKISTGTVQTSYAKIFSGAHAVNFVKIFLHCSALHFSDCTNVIQRERPIAICQEKVFYFAQQRHAKHISSNKRLLIYIFGETGRQHCMQD